MPNFHILVILLYYQLTSSRTNNTRENKNPVKITMKIDIVV